MIRVLAFVVLPLLLLGAAVWWIATNPDRVLGVDGEELGSSLARETPEPGGGICERDKGRRWRCRVETDPDSGSGQRFDLTTDGDSCWDAVPRRGSGEKLSGCVDLWDYAWPSELESQ